MTKRFICSFMRRQIYVPARNQTEALFKAQKEFEAPGHLALYIRVHSNKEKTTAVS